ncbi:MAG: PAS domain S-box protein, partial [Chloroflexi bacterium]|nr:PAS domain S-box protein [Chloroflexota bacterium]
GEKIRILLIEDNPGDARLLRELLAAKDGASFDLEHEDRLSTALARLAQGDIDVILLDLSLPDSQGLDGLNKICAQAPKVPIVVLSGLSDEAVAIKAVQEGAQDYLVKGSVDSNSLVRSLHYAIERQHLRVALRESESRYRLLADNVADVIWTADIKWRITYVSPSIKRLLGYTIEEAMKLTINDILTHDSMEQARKVIVDQMEIRTPTSHYPPISMTLEHLRKDGSTLWAEVMLSFLWDKDGKLIGIMGATRDITERIKAEEALRDSQDRYRLLADNSVDVIWTLDVKGRLTYVNPSITRLLGYTVDEVMATKLSKLFAPASAETARKLVKWGMATGVEGSQDSSRSVVLEHVHKDGSTIWTEVVMLFLRDKQGRLTGIQGVTRDITERKKAEEALRESEARYRELFENANDVIYTHDLAGNFTSINKAAERVTGYTRDEALRMNITEVLPPEQVATARQMIARKVSDGGQTQYELEIVTKDGHKVLLEVNTRLIYEGGKPVGVQGIGRDITERKKMEQALKESEERLRRYWDSSPDAIYIHDLKGTFLRGNKAGEELLGYSADEIEGRSFLELPILPPEYLPKAIQLLQLSAAGKPTGPDEFGLIRKDGRHVFVEISAYPMTQGDKTEVIGIARDITERKKAEEALRESEERYRRLVDNAQDIVLRFSVNKGLEYVSPAVTAITGYLPEELMADPELGFGLATAKDEQLATDYEKVMTERLSLRSRELTSISKDGRQIYLDMRSQAVRDKDGNIVAFEGILRDITERKRMEDALKQSEQSYRVLLESTHDSIIVVDAETFKITFGNRRASMMFGFDPVLQDAVGMNLLDFVHPEDREIAIKGFVEDLYLAERRRRYDVRAKTQDGREIWVSALGTRIEFQGRIAVLLSLRDVTKDKQMEEEKRRLEEQLLLAGRLAAVGELAAGVAHELNNPIAAIKGFAQFLTARKDLDETIRKDLDTIYRESQRAAKITQNLLSFARRHEPEKHPISINDVIENILEMQDHLMKVNNIELVVELAPDLPKTMADFHQMQQVFMNIVNNAEQAMLETHGKSRLLIKTQRSGKMVQITFADNGPGISEENLKRIFDPFFTTKEVGKGTGLGLSICYGLVEAHGGHIYARSKLGQGATVVVEMPIVSQNQLVAEAALLNPSSRGVKWNKPG